MAYSFDNTIYFSFIYRYTAATGTYSSNYSNTSDFSYFNNNFAVGDCLYFGLVQSVGYGAVTFHDLRFNVGTAMAATSYTLVWEYHMNGTWTTIPSLVDGTNSFSTTGVNTVSFPVPPQWNDNTNATASTYLRNTDAQAVNGLNAIWVRCRVTAVNTPTSGGAQTGSLVSAKDYAITVADEAAATMTDIYNADVAGSWGVVTKRDNSYTIQANMKFTGTTAFTSSQEVITLGDSSYDYSWLWAAIDNTTSTTFGVKDSNGHGTKGSTVMLYGLVMTSGTSQYWYNLKIYGSKFVISPGKNPGFGYFIAAGVCEFIDSLFDAYYLYLGPPISAGSKLTRVLFDFTYLWYLYTGNLAIDQVALAKACTGILSGVGNNTIQNVDLTGKIIRRYYGSNVTLLDCTGIDTSKITSSSPNGSSDVYTKIQYHLDMTVQDRDGTAISGATVTCKDSTATQNFSVTTAADGTIAEQTLTTYQKYYTYPSWTETVTTYTPFTITISAPGYQTKTITLTLDRELDELFVLDEAVPLLLPMGETVYKNLDPTNSQNKVLWEKIS